MKKIFYGWWVVFAAFIIGLYVSGVVFYSFTAFIEPLINEFGWSYAQVSFAASLRGLEMGILAFPIGFLTDRFGSRKVIFSGVISVGFGLLLLSFTRSLVTFYIAFLILSFGAGGCTSVVSMTAVANWFDKNVGKAMGIMASGFGASGVMVPVIVWLIAAYNWRATLIILGLGLWVLGIPLSLVVRNKPESYETPSSKKTPGRSIPPADRFRTRLAFPFREVLHNRSFLYLNAVESIRMMIVSAVITHVMPYLSSLGIDRLTAGLVATALPLCSILGRVGFGLLADIFDKRYVIAFGLLTMGAGILTFCCAGMAIWTLFPFIFLFSPGYGGMMVLRGAILREYFGKESFGKMIGFVMSSASIGGIIGPTLAGWVFDTQGSYLLIWLTFSALALLAILLALRVKPSNSASGERALTF